MYIVAVADDKHLANKYSHSKSYMVSGQFCYFVSFLYYLY